MSSLEGIILPLHRSASIIERDDEIEIEIEIEIKIERVFHPPG